MTMQNASESLSPKAKQIWEEVFAPNVDSGLTIEKSLERKKAIFDSLESGIQSEIASALTESGDLM